MPDEKKPQPHAFPGEGEEGEFSQLFAQLDAPDAAASFARGLIDMLGQTRCASPGPAGKIVFRSGG